MKKIYLLMVISFALKMDSSAQANTLLSNLGASTAVNHTLQPKNPGIINLGTITKKWKNLYLSGTVSSDSATIKSGLIVSDGSISAFSGAGMGVYGKSTYVTGMGVYGVGYDGIYGVGTHYGVYGFNGLYGGYGVYGSGGSYGGYGNGTLY